MDLKDIGRVASQAKDPESGERTLTVCFASLPEAIDGRLQAQGNLLPHCSRRLYLGRRNGNPRGGRGNAAAFFEIALRAVALRRRSKNKTVPRHEDGRMGVGRNRLRKRIAYRRAGNERSHVRNLSPHLARMLGLRVAAEFRIPVPLRPEEARSDFELEEIEFSRDAKGRVCLEATVSRPLPEGRAA